MEPLSAAHARFCLSLFQKISDGDSSQNVFFSPLSISAALSMLSLGAAGNTKDQMSQLKLGSSIEHDSTELMNTGGNTSTSLNTHSLYSFSRDSPEHRRDALITTNPHQEEP